MTGWWETCRPGEQKNVVLIQFDLGGHSAWTMSARSSQDVAQHRSEFALMLRHRLAYLGFDCLYWLGDGGVFARRPYSQREDSDQAVQAADVAFGCFAQFRAATPGADVLSFRATATLLEVVLHPESGQWFGTELNDFLKYERKLGLRDAFVITEPLYRSLSPERMGRFEKNMRPIRLQNEVVSVYTDSDHPFRLSESPRNFMAWLRRRTNLPTSTRVSRDSLPSLPIIGDAAIIGTAPTEAGYEKIVLLPSTFPNDRFIALMKPFETDWRTELQADRELSGQKAAPLRLTLPVTDDPALYIEYATVDYSKVHAFHHLIERSRDVHKSLLTEALRSQEKRGRAMPGSVAADVAVILSNKELLIAHRTARHGGYYPECWSASFEEQYAGEKCTWGGREHLPDTYIEDTIIRGLREEFVSTSFEKEIVISVQAIFLDLVNLNLQVLAVAQLPDTSFAELVERWQSSETPDRGEHDALASIPFNSTALNKALMSHSPGKIIQQREGASYEDRSTHPWHPRSQARIACCQWLVEEGYLS
jgi:hypothetical protein